MNEYKMLVTYRKGENSIWQKNYEYPVAVNPDEALSIIKDSYADLGYEVDHARLMGGRRIK